MNELSDFIITPKSSVSEVLEIYPQTIRIFLKHHMLCVGCGMADFDTIEEAAQNYTIPISAFLGELLGEISK
jgi:hybrid cluster-associated redox disulfide protein